MCRASTNIIINVTDVNDNAPEFRQAQYEAIIIEEDGNVPRELFGVRPQSQCQ